VIDAAKGSNLLPFSHFQDLNMFSRRLATFLLGIWMGCAVWVDFLALEGHRAAARILDVPGTDAAAVITKAGEAAVVGPLLHHLAAEQIRTNLRNWETAQLVIALLMLVLLVFTDQRRTLAIAMSAAMGLLVLIQHFGVTPDLNILGRSVDFQPESASLTVRAEIWKLTQVYGVLETLKLAIGGVLASYFFAMESTVKRSRNRRTRTTDDALSLPAK
jgi:hypothetical protein